MDQSISDREARYKMAAIALQAPTIFAIPTKATREPAPVQVDVPAQRATSRREHSTDEEHMLANSVAAEWAMKLLYQRYKRYTFTLSPRRRRNVSTHEDIYQ